MNSTTVEYAGFWRRLGGTLIDGVIVGLISIVFSLLRLESVGLSLLLAVLYQPFFEASELQGTPGKALLDMRITDMNGNRITFKKSLIRYAVRIVSSLFVCIGYLFMLFTEKKQTLHDLAAETLVVRGDIKDVNYFQAWYNQVLEVLGMVDKVPQKRASTPEVGGTSTMQASPSDLAGLYELYQKGILTEAEYNQKREELLKKL
ncbi:RDD family protein [Bdellovibrio sp. HCB337]|uniref:RDD family protein n=1 Tax=Bdellovibrio sp. HCB337 TaxID=3394358 RepID=UPI0039A49D21